MIFPAVTPATPPIEACRSTGTSPGRSGAIRVHLPLDLGGSLDARVGYELHGPDGAPPIVVLGGISASRHLAPTAADATPGWWPGVVGAGDGLDPRRCRLLGVDYPTPKASSAGARVTSRDHARVLAGVLDALAVPSVSLVGASYGGMVGLAFAELFPERTADVVVLCAAHRTHPMATALRSIQRRIVRLADDFGRPDVGLSLGRALAMTTYRSARELDARFDWRPAGPERPTRFPVEAYLDARGDDFAARFEPDAFVSLSESIDLHRVDPAGITARTTLVSVDSDTLVPPWLVAELADRAPGVRCHVTLTSVFGHDAFLKETEAVTHVIRTALGGEVVP